MNNFDALDLHYGPREPAVEVLDDISTRHPLIGRFIRAALRLDAFLSDRR